MNDNNTNEINIDSAVPTTPVTPEAPVAPEVPATPVVPVEPVAPVAPEVPVEPVAPVAPEVPVAPAAPVAPVAPAVPSEPVQPTMTVAQAIAQPIEQPVAPVQPVQPGPTPLVTPTPQGPKKNGLFTVLVIILILAIGGVGTYLFLNKDEKKASTDTTTTSGTSEVKGVETTQKISTTNKQVTTSPNTTTQARTTRSVSEPTPTKSNSNSMKIYKYNISLPGYEYYEKDGLVFAVSQTDKVQFAFNAIKINKEDLVNEADKIADELIANLQSQGFTITDAGYGNVGDRTWLAITLTEPNAPVGYEYVYLLTDLDEDALVEVYTTYSSSTSVEKILTTLTTALDNKTQAFADGNEKLATEKDLSIFDKLDERLFN